MIEEPFGTSIPWWWRYGEPSPIWTDQLEVVGRLIEVNKLEPIRRRPFPGGLRHAHLHHEGHIFALNAEQWSEFSQGVISDLKKKLDAAPSVRFTELLELSDTVSQFG